MTQYWHVSYVFIITASVKLPWQFLGVSNFEFCWKVYLFIKIKYIVINALQSPANFDNNVD